LGRQQLVWFLKKSRKLGLFLSFFAKFSFRSSVFCQTQGEPQYSYRDGTLSGEEVNTPKPDWTGSYAALRPVFFRIMWRLAQQGYVSDAGQGLDLIHDFFLDEWRGVSERFNPSLGTLKMYAAAAFERFARRRLVREARWIRMLDQDLVDEAADQSSKNDIGLALDIEHVRGVLNQLSSEDREILVARFASEPISERQLAREAGVSRYKFRERLAAALARFAASLGDAPSIEPEDFRIARMIFGEGLSISDVSAELSLLPAQVRLARRRLLRALGKLSAGGSS
jgi:DNA-directed RNA polymerase specialized sigma24 family protein